MPPLISLGLDDTYERVFGRAQERAAKPVDPAREQRESSTGVFREVAGVLEDAAVEPSAEMEQGERLLDEAEGALIVGTLDDPAERTRGFAALAALKRAAQLDPTTCILEARGALPHLTDDRARARALVELARPGATGEQLDRDALRQAKHALSQHCDCATAELLGEIAVLEHEAGADPSETLARIPRALEAASPLALAITMSRVAALQARCGADGDALLQRARLLLQVSDASPEDEVEARVASVAHRAEAGQFDRASAELGELEAAEGTDAARAAIRARGALAAALARTGDLHGAAAALRGVPRTAESATGTETIEALSTVSAALAEHRYGAAARRHLDEALLVLQQLKAAGTPSLHERAISALAVALAASGQLEDARRLSAAAGSLAPRVAVDVELATARAGAALVQEARNRRAR